ncbi:MAG: NAD-dependent epimerase/dehydratase family protein [Clostridiales bacterium]|jgi:GDP-L-fucose synthase|nr:NAD-dependent epimerase/dehydratase family protein [Clostridiales bacterium]
MEKTSRIYIAGSSGLVGTTLANRLHCIGYTNLITKTHSELDLVRQVDVEAFFESEKPEYVFLLASNIGSLIDNLERPAPYLYENTAIESNVIHSAHMYGAKKLLFVSSSWVYPRDVRFPTKETELFTSEFDPSNEPYGLAKAVGIKLCEYYSRQYNDDFISCILGNIYGSSHDTKQNFITMMFEKFTKAVETGVVEIWGTGKPTREFLHIDDCVEALIFLVQYYSSPYPINIGTGEEVSINDVIRILSELFAFNGQLVYDTLKPDGAPRRLLDSSKLFELGWKPMINLRDGLYRVYEQILAEGRNNVDSNN